MSAEEEALKIGVIADAHGNLAALEAVRDAMTAAAPDMVVNLGDLVSGPFDPGASAELQMRAGYHTVAGNHERQLQDGSDGAFDVLARPLLTKSIGHGSGGCPRRSLFATAMSSPAMIARQAGIWNICSRT